MTSGMTLKTPVDPATTPQRFRNKKPPGSYRLLFFFFSGDTPTAFLFLILFSLYNHIIWSYRPLAYSSPLHLGNSRHVSKTDRLLWCCGGRRISSDVCRAVAYAGRLESWSTVFYFCPQDTWNLPIRDLEGGTLFLFCSR